MSLSNRVAELERQAVMQETRYRETGTRLEELTTAHLKANGEDRRGNKEISESKAAIGLIVFGGDGVGHSGAHNWRTYGHNYDRV